MTIGWLRTFGPSFPGDPGEPNGAYACKKMAIQTAENNCQGEQEKWEVNSEQTIRTNQ